MPVVLKQGWFCSSECLAMSGNNICHNRKECYWHLLWKVKVVQSWPTLCIPMARTLHGILQARILEWVAFSFCRGSSQPKNRTRVSCIAGGFLSHWATREARAETRVDAQHPAVHRTVPHSVVSQCRASVVPRVKAGQALEHKHWGEAATFLESFEVSSLFLFPFPPLSPSSLPPPLSFLSHVYIYIYTYFLSATVWHMFR